MDSRVRRRHFSASKPRQCEIVGHETISRADRLDLLQPIDITYIVMEDARHKLITHVGSYFLLRYFGRASTLIRFEARAFKAARRVVNGLA